VPTSPPPYTRRLALGFFALLVSLGSALLLSSCGSDDRVTDDLDAVATRTISQALDAGSDDDGDADDSDLGSDGGAPAPEVGWECEGNADCGSLLCSNGPELDLGIPGGYCTALCDPAASSDCPDHAEAACVDVGDGIGLCLRRCDSAAGGPSACRADLVCDAGFGPDVCLPADDGGSGNGCTADGECEIDDPARLCLDEVGIGVPGGACARRCEGSEDCETAEVCTEELPRLLERVCLPACTISGDCDPGHQCERGACRSRCDDDSDCLAADAVNPFTCNLDTGRCGPIAEDCADTGLADEDYDGVWFSY
jgi:hypothetical protein